MTPRLPDARFSSVRNTQEPAPAAWNDPDALRALSQSWKGRRRGLDMEYPYWEVELAGDPDLLADLSLVLRGEARSVTLSDGRYVLRMAAFDELKHINDVRAKSTEEVGQLRGLLAVLARVPDIRVGSAYHRTGPGSGEASAFIEPSTGRGHVRADADLIRADGTLHPNHPAADIPEWRDATQGSEALTKAVRLLGVSSEPSWTELVRILEVAEEGVDAPVLRGWISKKKRGLLHRTANSVQASGDDARHGRSRGQTPPPNPMPLEEARRQIRHLVRQWLEAERKNRGRAP